jgi:hypothetical protein
MAVSLAQFGWVCVAEAHSGRWRRGASRGTQTAVVGPSRAHRKAGWGRKQELSAAALHGPRRAREMLRGQACPELAASRAPHRPLRHGSDTVRRNYGYGSTRYGPCSKSGTVHGRAPYTAVTAHTVLLYDATTVDMHVRVHYAISNSFLPSGAARTRFC